MCRCPGVMSRVGLDDTIRFLCPYGYVVYLSLRDVEFFSCFLINGSLVEKNVEEYLLGSLDGAADSWVTWSRQYPDEDREDWARYVLRVNTIMLGVRVRCALSCDFSAARRFAIFLLREFGRLCLGSTSVLSIDYALGMDLVHVVSGRRVFTQLACEPVYQNGLRLDVSSDAALLESVARCYEWCGWSDALFLLGMLCLIFLRSVVRQ